MTNPVSSKYKTKNSERASRWAKEHPEKVQARKRQYRRACKAEADRIKQIRGCARCGMTDPRCLDFHHTDPATKDWKKPWQVMCFNPRRVVLEAEKCIVLCSNCHRILHAEERNK